MTDNKTPKKPTNNRTKQVNPYAQYSGIALQMLIIIGLGTFAGVKLDNKYPNKYNLFKVIFSLVAVLTSVFYAVKRILSIAKENKE